MDGGGIAVQDTIDASRLDPAHCRAVLERTLGSESAYDVRLIDAHEIRITRVFRPRWATITGWITTVGLVGLGFWLFMIRRTEACSLKIVDDFGRCRVVVSGNLLATTFVAIQESLAAADPSEYDAGDADCFTPGAHKNAAFPDAWTVSAEDDATIFRAAPLVPAASESATVATAPLVLWFDDGRTQMVDTVIVVGRDPKPTTGGAASCRLVITDDMSVSKTHLRVAQTAAGIVVEDLHSTNGAALGTAQSSAARLAPGVPTALPLGATVWFGNRSFKLERG